MDLFAIAASGMAAATARLNVAASNTLGADQGTDTPPPAQTQPPAASPAYQQQQLVQFSVEGGGVGTQVQSSPSGDDPDLDLMDQTLSLIQFKANMKVFEAGDQAQKSLLNIKA